MVTLTLMINSNNKFKNKEKVIRLKDHFTGHKNYLHDTGWERGYKLKGQWHGVYESMGIIREGKVYYHSRGFYENGIKSGKWLIIYGWFDKRLPTKAQSGLYVDGKKSGKWSNYEYGSNKIETNYTNGRQEVLDDG